MTVAAVGLVASVLAIIAAVAMQLSGVTSAAGTLLFALAGLGMVGGALYTFVANGASPAARLTGTNVNVFAGVPDIARRFAYAAVAVGVTMFFLSIALIELNWVSKGAAEVAVAGFFFVVWFSAIFCGSWSALRTDSDGHEV